jgi:leucine dehydrogenase
VDLFEYASELQYGELHLCHDSRTQLRAIVAIHNLNRGPAIGGCRFIPYPDTNAAIRDAMRLARGMTYKAAISNLPHGGGKAVIMRPPGLTDEGREALFERYAQFIDSLGGRYLTCEDSGTSVADMSVVKTQTDHVLGYATRSGSSGDPSPLTALGVRRGIQAAVKFHYDRDEMDGLRVAIQGVGSVGYHLAKELNQLGVELVVTDVNEDAVQRCVDEFGAEAVEPDAIYGVECDIFAPCALGAVLNDDTIPRLECDIVAGASNNQLAEDRHGAQLKSRGILYAPDYALNAGGLINVAQEYAGYDIDAVREKVIHIYDTMLEIFERAESEGLTTDVVADRVAEERFMESV